MFQLSTQANITMRNASIRSKIDWQWCRWHDRILCRITRKKHRQGYVAFYWNLFILLWTGWQYLTGYFPSLAIQFDIALLCCISMFYYCIRVVSNKLHIYVNIWVCCQREWLLWWCENELLLMLCRHVYPESWTVCQGTSDSRRIIWSDSDRRFLFIFIVFLWDVFIWSVGPVWSM